MGHLGQVLGPSEGLHLPLAGGGRYAVFGLNIVDLKTGATRSLPAPSSPGPNPLPSAWVAAVDVARPRVFAAALSATPGMVNVVAFEVITGVSRPLLTTPACQDFGVTPPLVRHAAAANVLFVRTCPPAGVRSEVVAIDLRVEPPATRVVTTAPRLAAIEVTSDGTRIFAAVDAFFGPSTIEAYDTASGALVATASAPFTTMAWDDTRELLMIGGSTSLFDASLSAFDRDLRSLATASFPGTGPCGVRWQVSPHTGRIYVMTGGSDYYGAPPVSLTVFDGQPLASRGPVPITPSLTTCAGALRTAPGAPRRLRANVVGHDVTLHFENVGGASHFVLEAGFAPERTDVSLYLGPDSPVTFQGVPSGTYYLRLRGGNEFGGGRPSEELRVVVP